MSEQYPSSITNAYQVVPTASGLLVAREAGERWHTYMEHPHPLDFGARLAVSQNAKIEILPRVPNYAAEYSQAAATVLEVGQKVAVAVDGWELKNTGVDSSNDHRLSLQGCGYPTPVKVPVRLESKINGDSPVNEYHEKFKPLLSVGKATRPASDRFIWSPNADRILCDVGLGLFGTFDGMGRSRRSAKASRTAAKLIHRQYAKFKTQPASPDLALERIEAVMENVRRSREMTKVKAGTTAVFAKIESIDNRPYLAWANAGDSRLFVRRDASGEIVPVSSEQSNGYGPNNGINYRRYDYDEFGIIELHKGDRIMLCTDGITGDWEYQRPSEDEMQRAFSLRRPQDAAKEFIKVSKKVDDKAVVVVDLS